MTNNVSTLIPAQLSDWVQTNSPLFVGFLQLYYDFVQIRTNAVGVTQNRHLDVDIDETLDLYIDEFYSIYGPQLPKTTSLDRRIIIKLLNELYQGKGTDKSYKLLFKVLYDEDITVQYPSENMLRVSDGKWSEYSFITVHTTSGVIPSDIFDIDLSNVYGDFIVPIVKSQLLYSGVHRLFFITDRSVRLQTDQNVFIYNDSGATTFVGKLLKSPSKIIINDGGADWQRGQIVTLLGSLEPTIVRVTNVSDIGSVTGVEIIDYGYDHTQNQKILVSPYPNKPLSSTINVDSVLTSFPSTYHHYITIDDSIEGLFEDISGNMDGGTVIHESSIPGNSTTTVFDSGISVETWLASRANLMFAFDNVVYTKGIYKDDSGKVSNREIKIQDSYFYQIFSYVINATKDILEYNSVLNIIHPAGSKRFSNINKGVDYTFTFTSSRALSSDSLFLLDVTASVDYINLHVQKPFIHYVTLSEILGKDTNKYVQTDSVTVSHVESAVQTLSTYDLEDYFSQDYVLQEYTLTIG